jgi:organic hydroperoxide reductase OsmC/OhrA
MPATFPHHYSATIVRTGAARATLHAPPRPDLAGGAPPEFGGDATVWSPEHLLMASIGLCLETTFDAFATRDHLAVAGWSATVEGTLDRSPAGLVFTRIVARVELTVDADEVDRARKLLVRAEKACLVSAALKVPVELEATIAVAPDAAA